MTEELGLQLRSEAAELVAQSQSLLDSASRRDGNRSAAEALRQLAGKATEWLELARCLDGGSSSEEDMDEEDKVGNDFKEEQKEAAKVKHFWLNGPTPPSAENYFPDVVWWGEYRQLQESDCQWVHVDNDDLSICPAGSDDENWWGVFWQDEMIMRSRHLCCGWEYFYALDDDGNACNADAYKANADLITLRDDRDNPEEPVHIHFSLAAMCGAGENQVINAELDVIGMRTGHRLYGACYGRMTLILEVRDDGLYELKDDSYHGECIAVARNHLGSLSPHKVGPCGWSIYKEGVTDLRVFRPGLNFGEYFQYEAAALRRKSGKAKLVSVGGGGAYGAIVEYLAKTKDHIATVFFGDKCVFGKECRKAPNGKWYANLAQWESDGFATEQWHIVAEAEKWTHPTRQRCGRHLTPVPEDMIEHPKWLEPATGTGLGNWRRVMPHEKIPCWCCCWMDEMQALHKAGWEIQCATSNIFVTSWISTYDAGSTEMREEQFRHPKPYGWGTGNIPISGTNFRRVAKVHPDTKLPLGEGCRWERQVLDSQNFPVHCYFMP